MEPLRIKRCRVCDDQASGFNYGGLCCESCKVFFLRNATKKLTCHKTGTCLIDVCTRKVCPACRLVKCLNIGMIKQKPKGKMNKKSDSFTKSSKPHLNSESTATAWIRRVLEADDHLRPSIIHCTAAYEPDSPKKSANLTVSCSFSPFEEHFLSQLTLALGVFEDERRLPLRGVMTNLVEAFNWPSIYARRIVKFCKSMSAFKTLPPDDQLAILKQFYMNVLIFRISFLWDTEKSGYLILADETGSEALFCDLTLCLQLKNQKLVSYNFECLQRLHGEMENDETIRNLLIALALYLPLSNLSCKEFITYQYSIYSHLLQRHLLIKYKNNDRKAAAKYERLIVELTNFVNLKKNAQIMFKEEIDSQYIAELIVEIMEL